MLDYYVKTTYHIYGIGGIEALEELDYVANRVNKECEVHLRKVIYKENKYEIIMDDIDFIIAPIVDQLGINVPDP